MGRARRIRRLTVRLLMLAAMVGAWPVAAEPMRVGVLKFGTVNWVMDTIAHRALDRANGIEIDLHPLASGQALKVALQAEAVDVIVADWVWVARQRGAGKPLSFAPYSTSIGGLAVPAGSPIEQLSDLPGKRIGIGGGALDKSWILLQALAARRGVALRGAVEPVFGAPPLINRQLEAGRVDAAINYWHYVARLEAQGYIQRWPASDLLRQLGVDNAIPMLGFVFDEAWAGRHKAGVQGLVEASRQAARALCDQDDAWRRIAGLVKADTPRVDALLRERFCAGLPRQWGARERADAARVFEILRDQGGSALVGEADQLDPATFWPGVRF